MSLTSPAVSYLDPEGTALALWREWLASWFDGASHVIGASPAEVFPSVTLRFQQAEPPQPLDGISVAVVMLGPGSATQCWDPKPGSGLQHLNEAPVTFQCWVRAAGAMSDTASPDWWAARTAGLLYAILTNSASRHALSEKGIMRLRVRLPEPVPQKTYATRLVTARAVLRFNVLSQT